MTSVIGHVALMVVMVVVVFHGVEGGSSERVDAVCHLSIKEILGARARANGNF